MGERLRPHNHHHLEESLLAAGYRRVAGVDEAGRGCLAGPLFAAAVIFPPDLRIPGVRDSKLLTPADRERLSQEIQSRALSWAVASVDPDEIDHLNIHQASLRAMQLAVERLLMPPDCLLIDGLFTLSLPLPQKPVVRGDRLIHSIAAASILAKVSRDRWMKKISLRYPEYGFEQHKGYGTARHREALRRLGPSPIHRLSFKFS